MSTISLKATLNREHLSVDRSSVVFLAVEILPPQSMPDSRGMPAAICLLIDCSGSMKGKKIEYARDAAAQLVDRLQTDDYLGMVAFSDGVDIISGFEKVSDLDIILLKGKIQRMTASGNTEMYRGLGAAYEQIMQLSKTAGKVVRRVILLSDGKPTDKVPADEYARLAARMRQMGISIFTLGLGKDYNEDLLAGVAESSGGIWHHVASPADIPGLFGEQIDEARTVISALPKVSIHFEADVELEEIVNALPVVYPVTNFKWSAPDLSIPVGDIRAGVLQTLALKLRVPPDNRGSKRLATVRLQGQPGAECEVVVDYTTDDNLLSRENDVFPRGIFAAAQTQILTRIGISGDATALKQAERMRDTIIRDPDLTRIGVVRDAAENVGETILKAKSGMTNEETKIAKDGLTQIRRKQ
jgi:Ca-activated chloride channel family protein